MSEHDVTMADSAAVNSPDYWNNRFAVDWTARGGSEQTSFFARLAIVMLPDWFWAEAAEELSFLDIGCALGESLADFRTRLPKSDLTGVDVSKVAIRMARQRSPGFRFQVVKEDWRDAPHGDIVFCSNTLEHMRDWKKRLARLSELADHYVVTLVPFQERERIDEHEVTFDFATFPASLPDGKRLLYFRVVDAARVPDTHWPGHQALAIYGAKVSAVDDAPHVAAPMDPYSGLDFRGQPLAQIRAALLALQAEYPNLDERSVQARVKPAEVTVERINAEWAKKLEVSVAEMSAKHSELRAYYERVLNERDLRISQLSESKAWRDRAEKLENTLREARERELAAISARAEAGELRERQLREELERVRQEVLAAESLKVRVQVLEKEIAFQLEALTDWSCRYDALREDLAQVQAARPSVEEVEALLTEVKRLTADNFALKAAISHAIDERNQAQSDQGGLRIQNLESEVARYRAEAEASKANVAQACATLGEIVTRLDKELASLRRGWESDYTRLANRNALLEQNNNAMRDQLTRIVRSKSLKIGTSLRRIYWTLRGRPALQGEKIPEALPSTADNGSESLSLWDSANRAIDLARSVSAELASAPTSLAPPAASLSVAPTSPVATSPAGCQTRKRKRERVIALQVASLGHGGLERVVFDLAVGLHRRDEAVVVIAVETGGVFADELSRRGIGVHEVNRDVAAYENVLRENGVTDLFMHHSYFGYERAMSLGLRLYDVVHNYYFWHCDRTNMIRRVAELSTRIIYVSSAVRSFHERAFGVPQDKGVVINNAVHVDGLIVPEKPQLHRLRAKSAETIFLNVAQVFPSKAQPAMITAFARAHRRNSNIRLQIAGAAATDDAARAVQARIEAEGLGDAVQLMGHCDRRKISRAYAEAHAFVLPSLYEGYSVSAIEAATYGLPLILTNVGGAEDLITSKGCGILLPPAIDDLSKLDPMTVEKLGMERENAATKSLEEAFIAIAGDQARWIECGLQARYDIRSLDEVIDAYLATMPTMACAAH